MIILSFVHSTAAQQFGSTGFSGMAVVQHTPHRVQPRNGVLLEPTVRYEWVSIRKNFLKSPNLRSTSFNLRLSANRAVYLFAEEHQQHRRENRKNFGKSPKEPENIQFSRVPIPDESSTRFGLITRERQKATPIK